MGSDPNEKPKPRRKAKSTDPDGTFVVFRPTEAQKREIAELNESIQGCLDQLQPFLESGHRLIWGYRAENGAMFVHMREGNADFINAVTLSCWHADLRRCLQMMVYALKHVHTEYPLIQLGFANVAPDW